MLFTKVKVPSFNVEPDQTARMRLWRNFIRFCKYRFCVVAQVTSHVFVLSNVVEGVGRDYPRKLDVFENLGSLEFPTHEPQMCVSNSPGGAVRTDQNFIL